MAVKEFYVKNFSVFKELKIKFSDGINVIIGGNGVGKTHLLKFLYTLYESANERFRKPLKNKVISQEESANDLWSFQRLEFMDDCFRPYSPAMLSPFVDTMGGFDVSGRIFSLIHNLQTKKKKKLGSVSITTTDNISHELFCATGFSNFLSYGSKLNKTHSNTSVFIPANEMLTHATIYNMSEKYGDDMPYDSTCLNIIEQARRWKLKETPQTAKGIIEKLERIIEGVVVVKDDGSFWIKKHNGRLIPFSNEAEGLKRFGLLWQLLLNESINQDSIIFWDEPENSINPMNIPILVEILLEIQRYGVQVFVTTHNYNFARYFELLKKPENGVLYHNLFREKDDIVAYTQANSYMELHSNSIEDAGKIMYDDIVQKAIDES